jgi:succinyl-diaminopimelate desuccinylase
VPAPSAIDALALLRDLVSRPSVTPETAGVFDVLEKALASLGFAVTRLNFKGDGSYPVDNLFAIRGGGNGPRLLFAGHTDVVPTGPENTWTHPPFGAEIADGRLYGRGATDMKSGIAAFVAAVSGFLAEGGGAGGTIAFAITNDEEADAVNGTEKLMAWTREQGHEFDFAIVGEPSASERVGDSIKIGRRGSLNGQIRVSGTQGHVAYPEKANNPVPVLAAIAHELATVRLDTGTEHFPPSNLELTSIDVGNQTTNVIPNQGTIRFNIRFNDLWTPEKLTAWIEERIAAIDARGCTAAFRQVGRASRSFLSPLDGGVDLLAATIAENTGKNPVLSTAGGTSDARFIAAYCPVVEFGLTGASMHKVDENVALSDFEELIGLYAAFLKAYFA